MQVYQSKLFERQVKKLHKKEKYALDEEIKKIIVEPKIGQQKKGDLKNIFVYKYKFNNNP